MTQKAIVLDRDGTLIDVVRDEETGSIATAFHPSQLRFLHGAVEGLKKLRDAGYVFAIATNQPGAAKGHYSKDAIARTNDALVQLLASEGIAIVGVATCLHHPDGAPGGDRSLVGPCECRKPRAGMLHDLAKAHSFDPAVSWMIGDSAGDIQAGHSAGFRTALVFASNRCELCPLREGVGAFVTEAAVTPDVHGANLSKIAEKILAI